MAKQPMWVLLMGADDVWHRPKRKDRAQTRCGLACASVRRVSNAAPQLPNACQICVGPGVSPPGAPPSQRQGARNKKLPKAVVKKTKELRSQGVRADLAEALAIDALSRSPGPSVRTLGGGLPSLGRRSK